ncbi:MAG: DUF2589 domain-containing protein [Clostridia bacterium]|nr:DUF2589 domain-containing protein [Clostridia bacterium]
MFNPAEEMSSIAFDKILGGALNAVVSAQNNSSLTTVNFIKEVGFENDGNGNTVKPVYVDFKYPKEVAAYQPGREEYFTATVVSSNEGLDEDRLNNNGYKISKEGASFRFVVNSEGRITVVDVVSAKGLTDNEDIEIKDGDATVATFKIVKHEKVDAKPAVYQDMTLQVPLLTIVPIPFIRVESTDIELNVKINSIYNSSETSDTKVDSSMNASASAKFLFFKGNVNINASVSHQKKKSETEDIKKEYSLNIKIHAVQDDLPAGMSRILDVLEDSIVPKIAPPPLPTT